MLVAKHLAHRSTPEQLRKRKSNKTYSYYNHTYASLMIPFIKAMIEDRQPRRFVSAEWNVETRSLGRLVYRALQWLTDNESDDSELVFSRFFASTRINICKEKGCVYLSWRYPAVNPVGACIASDDLPGDNPKIADGQKIDNDVSWQDSLDTFLNTASVGEVITIDRLNLSEDDLHYAQMSIVTVNGYKIVELSRSRIAVKRES